MKNKLETVIIGAGSIGALKPDNIEIKNSEKVLTHAHAIYRNDNFKLKSIIDLNKEKTWRASNKWDTLGFYTLQDFCNFTDGKCDVIVVACNTENHLNIVKDIIKYELNASIIVIEKPCGNSFDECKQIIDLCEKNCFLPYINYNRKFTDLYGFLHKATYSDKILAVNVFYQRGLKRDGVHALHLLSNLLCNFCSSYRLPYYVDDFSTLDLTWKAHLEFDACKNVTLIPCDGREFCIFEIEIITNKKRIRTVDYGKYVDIIDIKQEEVYGNYKAMSYDNAERYEIDLHDSLKNLYEEIYDDYCARLCYAYNEQFFPTMFKMNTDDVLKVWRIIENILK